MEGQTLTEQDRMDTTNDPRDNENIVASNANNGLMTKIWGPHAWEFLHCVTFGYPLEPSDEQKEWYHNFFINIGNILPCRLCHESYMEFIRETGIHDDDWNSSIFDNRDKLTRWFYEVHNRVNQKLGVDYQVTYENVKNRYESYRAGCSAIEKGCTIPVNGGNMSFQMANRKDCPVIPTELSERFRQYGIHRGLTENDIQYSNLDCNDKNNPEWHQRNRYCANIIKNMRLHDIPPVEKDGLYRGFPSKEELRLIFANSSMIDMERLKDMANKLTNSNQNRRRYYFKK